MNAWLGAFACFLLGGSLLTAACVVVQHERDAIRWRRLVRIAGSEEAALLVVEQARMQRELDDGLALKKRQRPANVIRFRAARRGLTRNFPFNGDAA